MEVAVYNCLVIVVFTVLVKCDIQPPCASDIYCDGQLLHIVQMAHLHDDSKYFVDMPMRHEPSVVREGFDSMMNETNGTPSVDRVRTFVDDNFAEPGSEFIDWQPTDWKAKPAFLEHVRDTRLRTWMSDLNAAWKQLGRQVSAEVFLHPQRFSLVYVPNPTIVPGGRFREFYYWDSYWMIKGLLLSEMTDTVRGMLENFLSMVQQYGLVPNGGRVYFTRRSQPPLLTPMVNLYLEATGDLRFLNLNLAILEKEYEFWRRHRSVEVVKNGHTYTMYRYNARIGKPRPESYREDVELASHLVSEQDRQHLFDELASACETGWDFSSRWIKHQGTLKDLKTSSMIPVDLNSLMLLNAMLLADFSQRLGLNDKADEYRRHANQMRHNIRHVLWHEAAGTWYDWDLENEAFNERFFPSCVFPVWVGASNSAENSRFVDYLTASNVTGFASGVPASMESTGQQWDFPNTWPPLQHVLVESLQLINTDRSRQLALQQVHRWLHSVYTSYMEARPHAMFEKYDVTKVGLPGGGGEYDVQLGFGWSNGVAMTFVNEYGHKLVAPSLGESQLSTVTPPLLPRPAVGGGSSHPPVWVMAVLVPLTGLLLSIMLVWRRSWRGRCQLWCWCDDSRAVDYQLVSALPAATDNDSISDECHEFRQNEDKSTNTANKTNGHSTRTEPNPTGPYLLAPQFNQCPRTSENKL